jgi:hypothetical protein
MKMIDTKRRSITPLARNLTGYEAEGTERIQALHHWQDSAASNEHEGTGRIDLSQQCQDKMQMRIFENMMNQNFLYSCRTREALL